MNVLFEFYDPDEPILNLISCMVIKPDVCVFVGDEKLKKSRCRRPVENALKMAGMDLEIRFVPMDLYDYRNIAGVFEALLDEYSGARRILDVSGGNDLLLLTAGRCTANRDIHVVSHLMGRNCMVWLSGENAGAFQDYDVHITVPQAIAMAGGALVRHGHVNPAAMSDETMSAIAGMFTVYRENRVKWPQFVTYIQQADDPRYHMGTGTDILAPRKFLVNGREVHVDLNILGRLADLKVVEDIRINSSEVAFRYTSKEIAGYLRDVGIWLELYLYVTMARSGLFDHVDINTVVSWDDDEDSEDTINEIDLIATAGVGRMFISCKTALPDNAALNEIATLARRFGGRYAIPVLATMGDLKTDSPAVFRRAVEMGIVVLDADDLEPDALVKKLRNTCRRWDQ